MALFDINLLFYHTGTAYGFTAGEYMSLATVAAPLNPSTTACSGLTVNLANPRDLGIGDGEFIPHVFITVGSTGLTSACSSLQVNFQFQGSTDSITWSTYMETGYQATTNLIANASIFNQPIPRRLPGLALPQYYRVNTNIFGGITGTLWSAAIGALSSGSLLGGIVIQAPGSAGTLDQYAAGFSVS